MRRSIATAAAVVLGVALTPGAAPAVAAPADPGVSAAEQAKLDAGISLADKAAPGTKPAGPNPYLANVPDVTKADYAGWAAYMAKQSAAKASARLKAQARNRVAVASPILVDEDEPDGTRGSNDNPASAQLIRGFGTGANQNHRARVLGTLDPEPVTVTAIAPNAEDDGAIPLARDTEVGTRRTGVSTTGTVGDGPHGSAGTDRGDFDFYRLTAAAGDVITAFTARPTGSSLDSILLVYNEAGTLVAANDDFGGALTSRVTYAVTTAGRYYVAVVGYNSLPEDPFDSGSGTGAESEGAYSVTITAGEDDRDFFAVKLRAGDVLGATVKGAASYITVYDTVPREVHGSDQDATFIYPPNSPLPGGGNATTDYVATQAGWHYVGVADGTGAYDITIEAYRPPLQGNRPVQTLFLDFDGARVNTAIGGWGGPGVVTLSPLAAFLARWGITRAQEDQLIDGIVASVTESLKQDLIGSGLNPRFRLQIRNSKDHADPWGQPNVSRIIVGGTIEESGISTIGIAQSIDPGNFQTDETALVLLDVMSAPAGPATSLNTYLTPASDRIGFVAQAVGNVTSHEAGHYFGNWHTDNRSAQINLEDAGGANFQNLYGVGPDGVGGTADDLDVDFHEDLFQPTEGFVGIEDTLGRIVFGVTS
ncbi:MAG TPA: PPC domain-containing protein [Actinoplanes sp.]|nr:PPC domain-containing protein [Actinoplanes sp.]